MAGKLPRQFRVGFRGLDVFERFASSVLVLISR